MKSDNELINDWYASQGGKPALAADLSFYESDWSMLMPVVEKIAENYDFTIQFYAGDCACYVYKQTVEHTELSGVGHGNFEPHIANVYKSVVAFIKWYNQQKQ